MAGGYIPPRPEPQHVVLRLSMPDPVPVPLTDIEAAAADFDADTGPEDVLTLCEALRVAVEALAMVRRGCVVETAPDGHPCVRVLTYNEVQERSDAALAAVRELVDLGEKP